MPGIQTSGGSGHVHVGTTEVRLWARTRAVRVNDEPCQQRKRAGARQQCTVPAAVFPRAAAAGVSRVLRAHFAREAAAAAAAAAADDGCRVDNFFSLRRGAASCDVILLSLLLLLLCYPLAVG